MGPTIYASSWDFSGRRVTGSYWDIHAGSTGALNGSGQTHFDPMGDSRTRWKNILLCLIYDAALITLEISWLYSCATWLVPIVLVVKCLSS